MKVNLNLSVEEIKFEYLSPGDVFCNTKLAANDAYVKIKDIDSANGNMWNAIAVYEGTPAYFGDLADVKYLKNAELNLFGERRK